MKALHFLWMLLLLTISACDDDDSPQLDDNATLIFGHFYGFCFGESCVEVFQLTHEGLFEDTNDNLGAQEPYDFVKLDDAIFQQVRDLPDFLPQELLKASEDTFGCPDCADQGGLVVIYEKNGLRMSWTIDQFQQNVPEYLHEFMDKVNEKIALINN